MKLSRISSLLVRASVSRQTAVRADPARAARNDTGAKRGAAVLARGAAAAGADSRRSASGADRHRAAAGSRPWDRARPVPCAGRAPRSRPAPSDARPVLMATAESTRGSCIIDLERPEPARAHARRDERSPTPSATSRSMISRISAMIRGRTRCRGSAATLGSRRRRRCRPGQRARQESSAQASARHLGPHAVRTRSPHRPGRQQERGPARPGAGASGVVTMANGVAGQRDPEHALWPPRAASADRRRAAGRRLVAPDGGVGQPAAERREHGGGQLGGLRAMDELARSPRPEVCSTSAPVACSPAITSSGRVTPSRSSSSTRRRPGAPERMSTASGRPPSRPR